MKKIFALLLSLGTLSSVFAQQGRQNDNRYEPRDAKYGNTNNRSVYDNNAHAVNYSYSIKERDAEIKRINWEFDDQIKSVRKDRRLRPDEKNRQIAMLERQRDQRTQQVSSRYLASRNGHYDDRVVSNNNRRY